MPKTEYDKIRLLAVYHMILENEHISRSEITRKLEARYGIRPDKKTIMSDIRAIDRFAPIKSKTGRNGGYAKYDPWEECGWKST